VKVEAAFVVSGATARDLPRDRIAEVALVGRSNVGKSSLINALVRQRVARTSSAPGKTRLANVYRIRRGTAPPFYLVDLPGYGYARGDRGELDAVTTEYFGGRHAARSVARPFEGRGGRGPEKPGQRAAALLVVDARHPGLPSDVSAWQWLTATVARTAIAATKIDKLSRSERQRAMKRNEAVFEHPVLPVSADTGEGMEELWKLIDRLTKDE
jgi:GTP-binding protein